MSDDVIVTEVSDRVAVVTLNRPEARNALDPALTAALPEAIAACDARDDVDAIVLTGADPAFCAGVDLKSLSSDAEVRHVVAGDPDALIRPFPVTTKPVIGAVNGLCYGGGTVMATSMDFLIGCPRTSFRFLAVNYGQMNATWSLPRLVGINRAKELLYSGREVFADEAYHIGLINHLVPNVQLMDRTVEVAAGIAKNRAQGVANIKQMLLEHSGQTLEDQFQNEINARGGRFKGLAVEEGFKDFLERKGRKPRAS
jgi:enoyl-CoA hydratase